MRPSDTNRGRARWRALWLWVLLGAGLSLAWSPARTCYAQPTPPGVEDVEEEEEADDEAEVGSDDEEEVADEPADSETEPEADEPAANQPPDDEEVEEAEEADDSEVDEGEELEGEDTEEAGEPEAEGAEEQYADEQPEAAEAGGELDDEAGQPEPDEEDEAVADEEVQPKPKPRPTGEVGPTKDDKSRQMTAQERAAERRRQAAERAKQRKASRDKPSVEDGKKPPTKPGARPSQAERDKARDSKSKEQDKQTPKGPDRPLAKDRSRPGTIQRPGEPEPVVDVDIEEPDFDVRPESKTYQFSFENVEYSELLDAFARMSGLAIIGDPPTGKVTFKTAEVMDFKTAFNRIRLLLFRHRDIYWMKRKGNDLEVARITDFNRDVELDDFYPNVAAFRAGNRDENDLVMMLYTPERGSVDDLMLVRDFLPDYVRMAPVDDPTQNKMTVFALVKDINKFLDLVEIFTTDNDPRTVKKIPVLYVTPSEAVEALAELMDLSGGGQPSSPRKGQKAVSSATSREIKLLPIDEQDVILVRALPSDIEEIERLLPFIDVDVDPEFNPVVIELRYTTAAAIVEQMRPLLAASGEQVAPSTSPKSSKSRGKQPPSRSARAPAGTASTDEVTVVPEPRTNTLIVLGSDEGIARVREIVTLLDVPSSVTDPVRVELQHAKADELAGRVTALVQQARPGTTFSATADESTNSLLLLGTALDLDLARSLIKQWDTEPPTLHKHRVQHAKASDIAAMLSSLDSGTAQPTPARPSTSKGKSRKTTRQTPSRTTRSGKFIGDDATNILYVLCTDEEWENEYLPLIQELDDDARRPELSKHRVELVHADPEEALQTLTQILGADGDDVPQMVALADAILVIDATEEQINRIELLVPEIDVDPTTGIVQRTFELEHADPVEVRDVVLSLIGPAQQSPVRRAAPKKGGKTSPTPTPVRAVQGAEVTMVPAGQSLIVRAPADKMEEIAELVAQLDVPEADKPEIRTYPVAPKVDVQDLANTLTRFFGGQVAEGGKGGRRARRPAAEGITFIAQPAAHQLVVSAPIDRFEEIEEAIQLLAVPNGAVETVYKIIECHEGTAATLVGLIEPILGAKLEELISTGVVPAPQATGKGARKLYTIQADPRDDRIILTGPEVLVVEVERLVEEIGRPDAGGERVLRTVMLDKTDPEEMAQTIQAMLTGQQRRPSRPAPKGKGQPSVAPVSGAGGKLDVVVNPAPGGGALVLSGPVSDVDVVEGWIKQLDAEAVGLRTIKPYDLREADVELVVDTVMAVADGGAGAKAGRRPPKQPEDEVFFFSSKITRTGKDLYITADTFAGTMVVAATPAKLREVDDLVRILVGDDETEGVLPTGEDPLPYEMYELEYVDAFDAVYTLESIIDAIWPYEEKPQIESLPFSDILVIKGNPEHFGLVIDLIKQHVDKPKAGSGLAQSTIPIQGTAMTARDAALLLKAHLEASGVEVEVESAGGEEPGEELEEIMPCLLPNAAFAGVRAAVASVVAQEAEGQEPSVDQPKADEDEGAKLDEAELLRILAESQQTEDASEAAAEDEAPAPPRRKLHIRYDDKRGLISLTGPAAAVEGVEDMVKTIKEEVEKAPAPPEIRMFRLKYVSVTKAAEILDYMFNDRARRAQQAQMARIQQQLQRQQQRQRQQQARRGQQGEREQQEQPGQRAEEQEQPAQALELTVTVYPVARDRSIIIKAATEAFPAIVDLLKKIDRQSQAPMDYKIFTLKNNEAAEVEEQVRAMLGIGQQTRRSRARAPGGRGQAGGAMQPTADDMLQLEMPGGEGGAIAAEEITIASNATNNSIMVMAPQEAMELVERFINDMEELGTLLVTESYVMKHADATQVSKTVQALFTPKGRGGRDGAAAQTVVVVGDADSNTIFVTAPAEKHKEIAAHIAQIDELAAESITPRVIKVMMGTPTEIARTIEEALGGVGKGGRKSRIKITGDDVGKQLLVVAPEEVMPQIESLVQTLDKAPSSLQIKTYPLEHAQATEVLQGLKEMVAQAMRQLPRGAQADMFSATADERSNSLVVMGGPITFGLVEKVLADIDVPPRDPTQVVTAIYQLIKRNAAEVARNINAVYGSRREKGVDPPRAEANPSGNIVLVRGTKAQVDEIYEQVIKPLEESTMAGQVRKVHQLEEARASDVAGVINETLRSTRQRTGAGQEPVTVVANDPLNCLVISGTQQDYEDLLPLIQELDRKPEELLGLTIEVYQLKYADPGSTITTLQSSFPRLPGQKPEDTVRAAYAWGTSALVVSASPENQDRVKDLLGKIDVESTTGRKVHIVELKQANADELARKLGEVYSRSRRQQRDQQPISFTSELGTNSLLVYASDQEMEEIRPMIESLDVRPEFERDRLFKSTQLTYAECWEVKQMIDETFRVAGRQANPRDVVTTMAASASNSIVVSASPERMTEVDKLIEQVDKKEVAGRDVRVITVKHADPDAVSRALNDIFVRSTGGRRGQTIFISNPQGSDSILVKANDKEFAEIQAVVEQLDTQEGDIGGKIRVIPLQYTDATETLEILQEYLRKPGGRGGRGGELAGDMRISAATATNSLVISGDQEEIEHLAGIIAQIDVEVADAVSAPKIIKLQYAQASEIQPALAELFSERAGPRGGRGGGAMMTPVIVADDSSNAIIVRASAADYRQIERLVAEMDNEEAGLTSEMKIVSLKPGVRAAEMADMINDILEQQERDQRGRGQRGGGQVQRVMVSADVRTNSLILSGPKSRFAQIEELVRNLEGLGPAGGTVSQVIRLDNIAPEEAQQLLEQVVEESKGGSGSSSGSRRGRGSSGGRSRRR